jgi:hypothetical protein
MIKVSTQIKRGDIIALQFIPLPRTADWAAPIEGKVVSSRKVNAAIRLLKFEDGTQREIWEGAKILTV